MKAVLLERPHSGRTWLQSALRRLTCVSSPRLLEGPLDVGKPCAAFLAGQYRSFFEIFLKACQVRTMRRRDVFQVEEMHLVGGRVHLTGEEMRIGRNFNSVFGQPFPHFLVVCHYGEDAGIGLAFVSAAGAAIERRFIGIVVRRAAVSAEQDEPCEILRQPHHAQSRVHREHLLFQSEPGARDPLLLPRR